MTENAFPSEPAPVWRPPTAGEAQDAVLRALSTTPRQRITWTPGLILRRVLERERAGLSLDATIVQQEAAKLANAARRHFGSWETAVARARQTAAIRRPVHTRETIMARLREHAAVGLPVKTSHPLLQSCQKPAVRLFGSWAAALKAAGVPSSTRRSCARHTRESLAAWLLEYAAQGGRLNTMAPEIRGRYHAIQREFGSLPGALAATGLSPVPRMGGRGISDPPKGRL